MTRPFSGLRMLLLLPLLSAPVRAQDQGRFAAEIDPATFAMNGYSAHARIALGKDSKWELGAGVYGLDFPKAMIGLDSRNRDQGWDVRLKFGAGLFLDRYLSADRRGPFAGVQVASQQYRLRNARLGPGESRYTNLLVMPRVGYLWKPGSAGFYVMPWLGVG